MPRKKKAVKLRPKAVIHSGSSTSSVDVVPELESMLEGVKEERNREVRALAIRLLAETDSRLQLPNDAVASKAVASRRVKEALGRARVLLEALDEAL